MELAFLFVGRRRQTKTCLASRRDEASKLRDLRDLLRADLRDLRALRADKLFDYEGREVHEGRDTKETLLMQSAGQS